MARLIDADNAISHYKALANIEWNIKVSPVSWVDAYEEFIEYLEETPTVDAVEVVRCKDCRQWSRNVGVADSPNGHCFCHDIEMNGYDFCSYGEKREEA